MKSNAQLIAAIDVGTNSFHMVIASVNHKGMLQIRSRDKEMVRLGSSGGDMKRLSPDAIERGINTLKMFSGIAASEKAEIRAVATSAVREANNRNEFLDRVKQELGIDIEVVSGQEEGRLIYLGAIHALPIEAQESLIIDIGGGSTETIIGYRGEIVYVNSVKLGAIRLTKRFFPDGIATKKRIKECREYIKGEWAPTLKRVVETGFETVAGTAGTILNIAAMSLIAQGKDVPDILNGIVVKRNELLNIIEKIISAPSIRDRESIAGMDPKRSDIIIGGALILEHALTVLNIEKLIISTYALREGIVFDTIKKTLAIERFHNLSNLRYDTIYNLCRQYNIDMQHAEHVKKLALQIFDGLSTLHNLGFVERELLEAASLLHDAGYHISHDQHHKHSYYLILNSMMPGFTNSEAELIANIARYHRKSHPKKKHENFAKLTLEKQTIVKVLAGILRIAEGIDRRQLQIVKSVQVDFDDKNIKINLFSDNEIIRDKNINFRNEAQQSVLIMPDIELWGATRRKTLLEEALLRTISFRIIDR